MTETTSSSIARAGGRARAEALSPEQRSAIASKAAAKRWGTEISTATHSGEIVIGDSQIDCAVLEDGTRVINQSTFLTALGRNSNPKAGTGVESSAVPSFLAANNLRTYIQADLRNAWDPIRYRVPGGGRSYAYGYRAEILPAVCEVFLEARQDGVLLHTQFASAAAAEVLVRGLARVGIVALVDEATGYQETRARYELQRILKEYVAENLRPWLRAFPAEFFEHVYRLHGWDYREDNRHHSPYVGVLINKYIYDQLPTGVHEELDRRNPKNERGNRSHKHHQMLTDTTGVKALDRQIAAVTTLMKVANTKEQFEDMFERAFPPIQPRLPLFIDLTEG